MVELSSLDVYHLARELAILQDAFIDKVYETQPGELLLRTRHPKEGRKALLLKPGEYACLTAEPPEPPQSPTGFATVLRKHLPALRIRRVEQHQFDRVLVFHLDEHGEPVRMIVELFGKGNLVVVGADDVIRLAQRTETFRDRTVKRGETFRFPPARVNPLALTSREFDSLADVSERDAVRFLAVDCAFGGDVAEEILHRAHVAKDRKAAKLTEGEREAIWKAWVGILHDAPQAFLAEKGEAARPESIPFQSSKFQDWRRTSMPSLSAAIDAARQRQVQHAPEPVDEERARLERQIQHQEQAIQELLVEAALWERRGHHIYAHYAETQLALTAAREALQKHGWNDLGARFAAGNLHPGLRGADSQARTVTARIADEDLPLRPEESLERNASLCYEESKRIRAKAESAKESVAEARKRLEARAAPKPAAEKARRAPEKRFWFESFRWCYTSEGFLVVGGRDAGSNEKLVKKHLNPGDLYFHADFHGAPSCVLKCEGRTPSDASLQEAAHFAAAFSRAFAQFGSSDAYWVRPEQVSKTAPSGEFVAKGSFMVRGQRTYVPNLAMEVAVARILLGKDGRPQREGVHPRLMAGARPAIAAHASRFALVVRGDRKPADVAKELAARFETSVDEAQAVLPSSTLRIMGWEGASP